MRDFKKFLIPLATVITPNKMEAELLTKIKINSRSTLQKAAKKIQKIGAKNVVITGISEGTKMVDFILEIFGMWNQAIKYQTSIMVAVAIIHPQ